MKFEDFKKEIHSRMAVSHSTGIPKFFIDDDKGIFVCIVDGIKFTANSISRKITAVYNGRKFMFDPLFV